MFKSILKFLKNPISGILIFFIYFRFTIFLSVFFSITEIYIFDFVLVTSFILIFSEVIFRISYKNIMVWNLTLKKSF